MRRTVLFLLIAAPTVLGLTAGCALPPGDSGSGAPGTGGNDGIGGNDGTDGTDPADVTLAMISPVSPVGISVNDDPLTPIYSATGEPDRLVAFFVPVADNSPDADEIGDTVLICEGTSCPLELPVGEKESFPFDPGFAGTGFFRVGVRAEIGDKTVSVTSTGTVHVQGPPDPVILQPDTDIHPVKEGDTVLITFDAGDPENDVQWRLFFLNSEGQSQTLSTGRGNVGQFEWSLADLNPGDYQLGLSATDSGFSVTTTEERGDLDRIVTVANREAPIIRIESEGTRVPPTLSFEVPGTDDVTLSQGAEYEIRFNATVNELAAVADVDIFFDTNRSTTDGVTLIQTVSDVVTALKFPTDEPGVYFVGGTVWDKINDPVTTYAAGRITVEEP